MNNYIKANQLPLNSFLKIGITEEEIYNMGINLVYLMTFRRTGLLTINNPENPKKKIKAKLSLVISDGKINLKVHPVLTKTKNTFKLGRVSFSKLKEGYTVYKKVDDEKNSNLIAYQIDRETKEILSVNINKFNVDLSRREVEELKKTDKFPLNTTIIKLDLTDSKGYQIV